MIRLDYEPHPGQRKLHACRARFVTVCCGRRWGKTKYAAAKLLDEGGEVAGDYGWIAPTYLIADRGVEALREIGGSFIDIHGDNPTVAEFDGAGGHVRILFLSADRPQAILGFGFMGIVVDETAQISANVWTTYIRPTLSDHMGWATLISTPRGRNWFFDMFTRGTAGEAGYASFTFPSNSNPYFPAEEWEEARRTLPSDVFRQEYMAEFLEDSAGVFRGIERCLVDETRQVGRPVIGIDLAKHNDYTVLVAMDGQTGDVLNVDRFNLLDWPVQKRRIRDFCLKWGGTAWMEVNNMGDAIYDDLKTEIPDLRAWITTNATKTQAIQTLSVDIEQERIHWPRKYAWLTDELKRFEFKFSARGTMIYGAPEGYHDDGVMGLSIANVNRPHNGRGQGMPVLFGEEWPSGAIRFGTRRLGSKTRLEVC